MITATLNSLDMPRIQRDFINTIEENATNVTTLSGELYTDFVSIEQGWIFNYAFLTKAEYDAIRAIYDSQFTDFDYPLLSIPFFDVENAPVRMTINDHKITDNCGDVENVQFVFRITDQLV